MVSRRRSFLIVSFVIIIAFAFILLMAFVGISPVTYQNVQNFSDERIWLPSTSDLPNGWLVKDYGKLQTPGIVYGVDCVAETIDKRTTVNIQISKYDSEDSATTEFNEYVNENNRLESKNESFGHVQFLRYDPSLNCYYYMLDFSYIKSVVVNCLSKNYIQGISVITNDPDISKIADSFAQIINRKMNTIVLSP